MVNVQKIGSDKRTLGQSDVMKIDFGVAIEGHVNDSAFTVCFDERFKPLIDARISEIAGITEEIISSYQIASKVLTTVEFTSEQNRLFKDNPKREKLLI